MSGPAVSLLDYGVGNLGSVRNMFKRLGVATEIVSQAEELDSAERVLLPGVGAFDTGMRLLTDGEWVEAIHSFVDTGRPFLGICLGMQLLLNSSEEGSAEGLGIVPGRALRFDPGNGIRVPHMGWNTATPRTSHPLFEGQPSDSRFYFVHSYYAQPESVENVLAFTEYGHEFASALQNENVLGTQFHPEKSHKFGMKLLSNFSEI